MRQLVEHHGLAPPEPFSTVRKPQHPDAACFGDAETLAGENRTGIAATPLLSPEGNDEIVVFYDNCPVAQLARGDEHPVLSEHELHLGRVSVGLLLRRPWLAAVQDDLAVHVNLVDLAAEQARPAEIGGVRDRRKVVRSKLARLDRRPFGTVERAGATVARAQFERVHSVDHTDRPGRVAPVASPVDA
jgi:hypothetical protein